MKETPVQNTTTAEAWARRHDPEVWAMEPPDISAAQGRKASLIRARFHLGEIWWNLVSEQYEETDNG